MRKIIYLLIISMLLVGCSGNQAVLPGSKQDTSELKSSENNGNNNRVPPTASSPVIVQSAPQPAGSTDVVLDDISQELDNLTNILNGMEEPDTAWDEEVDQQ